MKERSNEKKMLTLPLPVSGDGHSTATAVVFTETVNHVFVAVCYQTKEPCGVWVEARAAGAQFIEHACPGVFCSVAGRRNWSNQLIMGVALMGRIAFSYWCIQVHGGRRLGDDS